MAGATPSSRDDFPMNAFALLPPSMVDDGLACDAQSPEDVDSGDGVEGEESVPNVRVSSENSMLLLKLNLAHAELRETIETLYHAIDTLENENAGLRRDSENLANANGRLKEEATKNDQTCREKRQAQEHETMQLSQKLREMERHKDRLQSELAELKAIMDEKDTVISGLQDAVGKLTRQHRDLSEVARRDAEIRQLVEMWSSKERSVAENTDHVRNATMAVQQLGEQLETELKHAQLELRSVEEEHETFRSYLHEHQCTKTQMRDEQVEKGLLQELTELKRKIRKLEQARSEQTTRSHVLETKCAEYKKSIKILSSQLADTRAKMESTSSLIARYEASATDGTETIAELQESLVKLCDQLSKDRNEHEQKLKKSLGTAVQEEVQLKQRIGDLEAQVQVLKHDLETSRGATEMTEQTCAKCSHREESRQNVVAANDDELAEPSTIILPAPKPNTHRRKKQELPATAPQSSASQRGSQGPKELIDNDEPKSVQAAPRSDVPQIPKRDNTACRLCDDEAFGFMVRCQKCKDPFHAGCVKNDVNGAKKRLGHIFKCSNCAPQRPTKVAKVSSNGDVSRPISSGEAGKQRQHTIAAPLHLTPSRGGSGSVSRPTQAKNGQ